MGTRTTLTRLALAILLAAEAGCVEVVSKPVPPLVTPPEVSVTMSKLLALEEQKDILGDDYPSTSLNELSKLGTPAGLQIYLRYYRFGTSLVEAMKGTRDRQLLRRVLDLAQFSSRPKLRAEALVTVGSFSNPNDIPYFRQALMDKDLGIQFAAMEGLRQSGIPEALAVVREAMTGGWSPLLKMDAAEVALELGDRSGLKVLYDGLQNRSWIVRAFAARYLGDHAPASDYRLLYGAMNQENENDFVVAELAIGALKLLSESGPAASFRGAHKAWRDDKEPTYTVAGDNVVEVEPLVIVPPRLFIPDSVQVAEAINNRLLSLMQNRLSVPLSDADKQNPDYLDLGKMLTPSGLALQTRYSALSVLVAEGLGGTRDKFLRNELTRLAQDPSQPVTSATALLSLAYARDPDDIVLITQALQSSDSTIRFGAMEAAIAGRFQETTSDLISIASSDPVPAFRVFAMDALTELGNPTGENDILTSFDMSDWPARAMVFWVLGRRGTELDQTAALSRLTTETNPFVQAEMALAAQRLAPI